MSQKEKGVTLGLLSIALISMAIILIISLMRVYLSNQIYHESRKVNVIEAEVAALKEENSILHIKVEKLKYKSRIEDQIFSLEENEEVLNPVKSVNTKKLWEGTGNDQ